MNIRKLNREEFTHAVRRGFGSAFLHVVHFGDEGIEDVLLDACLKCYVYDRQIDSSRANWLASIIDKGRDTRRYADRILEAIGGGTANTGDMEQLIELAAAMFCRGFCEFKQALWELAPSDDSRYSRMTLGEALIVVGGKSGLDRALSFVEDDEDNCSELMQYARQLEVIEEKEEHAVEQSREKAKLPTLSLEEFIAEVERDAAADKSGEKFFAAAPRSFLREASEDDLAKIMKRIDAEEDPRRLYRYLNVFRDRPMLWVPPNVVQALKSELRLLRLYARNALAQVKSSEVRDIGLEFLHGGTDEAIQFGLDLLRKNAEERDLEQVREAVSQMSDLDEIHWAGIDLMDITKCIGTVASDLLIWTIEAGPCCSCRHEAIAKLIDWEACPIQMLFEAQWDCDSAVRNVARSAFN